MKVGSVCSGISADAVAWAPLGFEHQFFAEIEAFPSAVLAHRFPGIKNHGDFTKIGEEPGIDLLVGGTPCQSFSVAGLRGGMGDDRGNLALEFLRLAGRLGPRWIVWENVPGVLSSNGGRDFGSFLGALAQLGYGFAYRVLDAQFCRVDGFGRAVPQRRRRVFVVGYLGSWTYPAAVLFDRESVSRNPAPRRQAESDIASALTRSLGSGGACAGRAQANHLVAGEVSPPLTRSPYGDHESREGLLVAGVSGTITRKYADLCGRDLERSDMLVAHTLRGEGFDASEDGTGRGIPLVAQTLPASNGGVSSGYHQVIPFDTTQITSPGNYSNPGPGDPSHPLARLAHAPAVAFAVKTQSRRIGQGWDDTIVTPGVRRLTPVECERLMGFPDDWTKVPYRGKLAKDGPRYKAIGNSMAVNCMRWLGRRIKMVESLMHA